MGDIFDNIKYDAIKNLLLGDERKWVDQTYKDAYDEVSRKVKKYQDIGLIPNGVYNIGVNMASKKGYKYGTFKK